MARVRLSVIIDLWRENRAQVVGLHMQQNLMSHRSENRKGPVVDTLHGSEAVEGGFRNLGQIQVYRVVAGSWCSETLPLILWL